MSLKKIPPINIILFIIMLGVVSAGVTGLVLFIKSNDNVYNNYVESTYNAALSKHYTDSLSQTPLAKLGNIEIAIYDSVENTNIPFVLCRISNNREVMSLNEAKKMTLTTLLAVFPEKNWYGEFNYRIREVNKLRSTSMQIHPIQLEIESEWPD